MRQCSATDEFPMQVGMFNAAIRETPSSNDGSNFFFVISLFSMTLTLAWYQITLISKGLTALETWCLAMIGLVFITLIAYGIILVQLHQNLNERSWRLELCMFVTLVVITICFVLAFLIHCFVNTWCKYIYLIQIKGYPCCTPHISKLVLTSQVNKISYQQSQQSTSPLWQLIILNPLCILPWQAQHVIGGKTNTYSLT